MAAVKIMLSEAIEEYHLWQAARQQSKITIKNSTWVLRALLRNVGDRQISNLKAAHVERWFYGPKGLMSEHRTGHQFYSRTNKPLSPNGHNFYRQRVKAFTDWAMSRGYIKDDVLRDVHPMKVPAKKRQRPTAATMLNMLEVVSEPRDRGFIAVCINTALRASEVVRMRVGDVDLDAGHIAVDIKKTGQHDLQPITADLDQELRVWLKHYAETLSRNLRADDYLFPHKGGNLFGPKIAGVQTRTPVTYHPEKQLREPAGVVQRALGQMNLPVDYEGVHTIRRAVARAYYDMLVRDGHPDMDALRMTQALLHHARVTTTEIYLGLDVEKEKRDKSLKGQPFLSSLVANDNVIPLKKANLNAGQ